MGPAKRVQPSRGNQPTEAASPEDDSRTNWDQKSLMIESVSVPPLAASANNVEWCLKVENKRPSNLLEPIYKQSPGPQKVVPIP